MFWDKYSRVWMYMVHVVLKGIAFVKFSFANFLVCLASPVQKRCTVHSFML